MSKEPRIEYLAGAGGDGYGFLPVISCFVVTSQGKKRTRWVLHHPKEQFKLKDEALAAADARIAVIFDEHPEITGKPDLFASHLRAKGFTDLKSFVTAASYDQDRRSALGNDYQPAIGDAAARADPELHAKVMEIVETQLREGIPEETRLTFERLQAAGYNPELARRLIGYIVVHELNQEMVAHKPFKEEHYVELLRRLPDVPPPHGWPKPKL
ncbi:MAG TPA: hypothetical protein VH988_08910 [Thermoanaerobaculia bacterium]|jgi:hypothetical protein|nr:hypothetical protein [Thermoanaerobaculia bacterium]